MRTLITNGTLLDTTSMTLVGERHLVLEGDRIAEVAETRPGGDGGADVVVDARGRFVMPGFVDAHVHHVITSVDFSKMLRASAVERSLAMAKLAEAMVRRGFTTVRDAAGDVGGLVRAIDAGLCLGPRIATAGRCLSQTGGHGDVTPPINTPMTCAPVTSTATS